MKKNKILLIQIAILAVLVAALIGVSALTYDSGIIDETPTLSPDPESEDYYIKKLNSEDYTISCAIGMDYELCQQELIPESRITMVGSWYDMPARVGYGKEDAFFCEKSSVQWVLDTNKTLYSFDEPAYTSEYNMAFAYDEDGAEQVIKFNEYINTIRNDGTLEYLEEKWEGVEDENDDSVDNEHFEYDDNAETLSICIMPDWPPYEFVRGYDGVVSGIFVDVMNGFCAEYGYRPEYTSVMMMESGIMGMSNGTFDVMPGGVYSEERAETIRFSDTVVSEELYIVVRASEVIGADLTANGEAESFFGNLGKSLEKNLILFDRWKMLAEGLGTTLLLSVSSVALGTVLGFGIYYLCSRKNALAAAFGSLYISIFQKLPDVLLLLLMCYVVFGNANIAGELVCIITFSLNFAAYVAEIMRSGVDAVPKGQTDAALALGYSRYQAFFRIVMPQVIRQSLPVYKAQVVTLALETSIAGYIAVEDLTKMSDIIRANTMEALIPMIISAILYFALTTAIGAVIGLAEHRLDPRYRERFPKWVRELQK